MKKIIIPLFISLSLSFGIANAETNVNLLNKIGYGTTSESLNNLKELGFDNWVLKQTDPKEQYKDNLNKYNLPKTNEEIFSKYSYLNKLNEGGVSNFESEVSLNGLLGENLHKRIDYALNSENRVREMMVYFWFNHFNIGIYDSSTSLIFLNGYEDMIRENSLGSFKTLLSKVAHSPAMLHFLNNSENQVSKKYDVDELNENYAREFLELHTMGVDNGYTQKDVIELAKILSGHSDIQANIRISNKDNSKVKSYKELINYVNKGYSSKGRFEIKDYYIYKDFVHDQSEKTLLGNKIKPAKDKELDEAIEIITKRPETAHFISQKLAIYFLNDNPSEETINDITNKFIETDGNISEVLRVLFFSEEFKNSLDKQDKTKDGYTYILSTAKTSLEPKTLKEPELINQVGQFMTMFEVNPYQHVDPDGFSIKSSDWKPMGRLNQYNYYTNKILNQFSQNIDYSNLTTTSGESINSKKQAIKYLTSENWLTK